MTNNHWNTLQNLGRDVQNFLASAPRELLLSARGVSVVNNYQFDRRLGASDCYPSKQILEQIKNTSWILYRTETRATAGNSIEIYRLKNTESGTVADFSCTGNTVWILFFEVAPSSLSKFWTARRDFSALYHFFIGANFTCIAGHALQAVNRPENKIAVNEWRDTRIGKDTRLSRFWKKLGAAELQGELNFLSPKLALKAKELSIRYQAENPYLHLSPNHSVFEPALAKTLREF